jgi:DEAD/DEAH box helicase domain-containing protein
MGSIIRDSGLGIRDSGFASDGQQTNPESQIANPDGVRVFIYDNYPAGIGFSAPLYQMHGELLANTRKLIAECPCENGCPGCVGPIGNTGPFAKLAALRILDLLLACTEDTKDTKELHGAEVQPF